MKRGNLFLQRRTKVKHHKLLRTTIQGKTSFHNIVDESLHPQSRTKPITIRKSADRKKIQKPTHSICREFSTENTRIQNRSKSRIINAHASFQIRFNLKRVHEIFFTGSAINGASVNTTNENGVADVLKNFASHIPHGKPLIFWLNRHAARKHE